MVIFFTYCNSFFKPGCQWTIMTTTLFKSHSVSFKLNELKNDITMDGRNVQFVVTQAEPNQWIEVQSSDKVTTLTRNFLPERMEVALKVNNVIASSIFIRRAEE